MANHKSDPLFLHPILHARLAGILAEIKSNLPTGWRPGTASEGIHRTPAEQFTIFQKGRAFQNGSWVVVDKSKKVTNLDGYKKKSRHNYLPATAVDIVFSSPTDRNWRPGRRNKRSERAQLNTVLIGAETGVAGRIFHTSRFR